MTEATEHEHTHVILSSAIQTIQKRKKKAKGDFTKCFRVCWVTEVERYPMKNYEAKTNIWLYCKAQSLSFLKAAVAGYFFPDTLDFSKMWSRGSLSDKCRDKACIPRVGSTACAEAWVLVTWKYGPELEISSGLQRSHWHCITVAICLLWELKIPM